MRTTRRRLLRITAALGTGLLIPRVGRTETPLHEWRGSLLGAVATIRLAHPDAAEAERILLRAAAEVERLDRTFSLYRADSVLVRLNAEGELEAPPLDLVRLLAEAGRFHWLTQGVFDPTVQPLWQLYAAHFERTDADPAGPKVEDALALIGWRNVQVESARVALASPGAGLTLNGIAQGYATDRVAELLRREGMTSVLLSLGEIRAVGRRPDGRPWQVQLQDATETAGIVPLADEAVATSTAAGTRFEPSGRSNHLFDPRTGRCAEPFAAVTVLAPDATTADALATAFALMPDDAIRETLTVLPDVRAYRLGAGTMTPLGRAA